VLAAPLTRRRFSSSIGRLISFDQVSPPDRILSYRFALWEPIRHAASQQSRRLERAQDHSGGLSRLYQSSFISVLGDIFEHSPWVGEGARLFRPFADEDALHSEW
jgi:hypothetical protein